jgi:hypothetical protein
MGEGGTQALHRDCPALWLRRVSIWVVRVLLGIFRYTLFSNLRTFLSFLYPHYFPSLLITFLGPC